MFLIFCNESSLLTPHWLTADEIAGQTTGYYYPDNTGLWDSAITDIEDSMVMSGAVLSDDWGLRYFTAGLMSFGPTPIIDVGGGNAYGLTYCKPTARSYPSWLTTTEHAVGGDYATFQTSITLADYQAFFNNALGDDGEVITHVHLIVDDTSSMHDAVLVPPATSNGNIVDFSTNFASFKTWIASEGYIVSEETYTNGPTDEEAYLSILYKRATITSFTL